MDGNDQTSSPAAKTLVSESSISNIFHSIQQKLKEAKTGETGDSRFTASFTPASQPSSITISETTAPASERTSDISEVSLTGLPVSGLPRDSPIATVSDPEQTDNAAVTSVSESEPNDNTDASVPSFRACSDDTGQFAAVSEVPNESMIPGPGLPNIMSDNDSGASGCLTETQRCRGLEDTDVPGSGKSVSSELPQAESPGGVLQHPDAAKNNTSQRQCDEVDKFDTPAIVSQESSAGQFDNIIIKQEKEDFGYEFHCYGSSFSSKTGKGGDMINEQGEASDTVIKTERLDSAEHQQGNDGDVTFCGIDYRVPDDSDSGSDSDTSESSFKMEVEEPVLEPEDKQVILRTRGEMLPEELPPLENLHISLPEDIQLVQLGVVTGVVGVLVVVESTVDLRQYSPLNDDTVLFFENKQPLGVIFEVFGQCKAPAYCIRFNSTEDIKEKGIEIGLKVFFLPETVPEVGEITHYVFVNKLKQIKGSDASWENNNEPPENYVEYSDDEEEQRARAKRKAEKNKTGASNPRKRGSDNVNKYKTGTGKKKPSSTDKEAEFPGGTHHRPGMSRSAGNSQIDHGNPFQQAPSFGQRRGLLRPTTDFRLSGPTNTTRHPPPQVNHWGPPARPPVSENFGNGPFPGGPFPRSGPFDGGPVRAPFAGSFGSGPFSGGPVGTTFPGSNWRYPHPGSLFPFEKSLPPPTNSSFLGGQMGSLQRHPQPPFH